ncbi:MAG: hypothetical protein H0T85_06515 [Geodermatophilaceae bacterium]|nr:hypothetical protein [Geodermatophilaceae bacterium]
MTAPDPAGPAVVAGLDVDVLAAAVRGCAAVADLSGGLLGSVGTYLPGRRVPGLVVQERAGGQPPGIEVHVVARFGPTMAEVASQVRAALAMAAPNTPVDLVIDDIDTDTRTVRVIAPH